MYIFHMFLLDDLLWKMIISKPFLGFLELLFIFKKGKQNKKKKREKPGITPYLKKRKKKKDKFINQDWVKS